jgi:hypothetical protein
MISKTKKTGTIHFFMCLIAFLVKDWLWLDYLSKDKTPIDSSSYDLDFLSYEGKHLNLNLDMPLLNL